MTGTHTIDGRVTITTPAYDVNHPAQTVYSTGFETGAHTLAGEGWAAAAPGSADYFNTGLVRSGTYAAMPYVDAPGGGGSTVETAFTKTFAGLTVGRAYTFAVYANGEDSAMATRTDQVRVGVVGIGNSAYTTLDGTWKRIEYTFTATATSHTLVITGNETDPAPIVSLFYLDDVTLVRDAWVEHFPAVPVSDVIVDVEGADLTLDDSWTPYGQVSLVCKRPAEEVLQFVDPRTIPTPRMNVTVSDGNTTRVFQLVLRTRAVDHVAATMTLAGETDEALLIDNVRVATTVDSSAQSYQASLRSLINAKVLAPIGAVLAADGGADADLTVYADQTNLVTNPSFEVDTLGWTAVGATATRATGGGVVSGSNMCRVHTPTVATSARIESTSYIPVIPGEQYVLTGWLTIPGGTAAGTPTSFNRCLMVVDTAGQLVAYTASAVLGNGNPQQLTVAFTMPAGVDNVKVRLINGHPSGAVAECRFDAVKLSPITRAADTTYFDGSTPDTAQYRYDWTGTAHASTSTRTDLTNTDRDAAMFDWSPGQTLWDFADTLVQAAGLRFYADESRVWHLVDPSIYTAPGLALIDGGRNATDGTDTISRYGDWFDSVVIRYQWQDTAGITHTRWDAAGAPGSKTLYLEKETAYPGAGAAAGILKRAAKRGRVLDLEAVSDYAFTPTMAVLATLPSSPLQQAMISAITWTLPDDRMRLVTRESQDVPPASWIDLLAGESWNASPVGANWVSEPI